MPTTVEYCSDGGSGKNTGMVGFEGTEVVSEAFGIEDDHDWDHLGSERESRGKKKLIILYNSRQGNNLHDPR